jgi:hypothetical protein
MPSTMKRRSPQEKKSADLEQQIRPLLENPHAFRKNWPKKKARVNRQARRKAEVAIQTAVASGNDDALGSEAVKRLQKGQKIRKSFVMTLGEALKRKQSRKGQS